MFALKTYAFMKYSLKLIEQMYNICTPLMHNLIMIDPFSIQNEKFDLFNFLFEIIFQPFLLYF